MAAPILFLPGITEAMLKAGPGGTLARDVLAKFSLDEALADVTEASEVFCAPCPGKTPSGDAGILLSANAIGRPLPTRQGYYPDLQDWTDVGPYWIGTDKSDPVTPQDLLRKSPRVGPDGLTAPRMEGYSIKLDDGHEWEVPVIRSPKRGTMLPQRISRLKGVLTFTLAAEHQRLWSLTQEVEDYFYKQSGESRDFEWVLERAVAALAVNYRLSCEIASVLGLLTTVNWKSVLEAMIDLPVVLAALEKKTQGDSPAGSPNTPPGSTDSTETTAPAAAS